MWLWCFSGVATGVADGMMQVLGSAVACPAAARVAGYLITETLETLLRVQTEVRFSGLLRHTTGAAKEPKYYQKSPTEEPY